MQKIKMSQIKVIGTAQINKTKELPSAILEIAIALIPLILIIAFSLIANFEQATIWGFFKEGDFIWVAASFSALTLGKFALSKTQIKGVVQNIYVIANFIFAFILVSLYCVLKIVINQEYLNNVNEKSIFILQIVLFIISVLNYLFSKSSTLFSD